MREAWVQSLVWEDLEKEMATHSSILAWKIPWMEKPGRLYSMGSQTVGHDWATSISLTYFYSFVLGLVFHLVQSLSRVWLLQPHSLQHSRLCCLSPTPRDCSTHIHWVSDAIKPSHHLSSLLLLPLVFPNIRVFSSESVLHIRWPNIGASASVLPMNIQDWFPLGLTGLICLMSKGLSRVFSSTTVQKH